MDKQGYDERVASAPRPLLVEFWAAWCAPCRAMAPALEQTAREFDGQVDLLRVNADESAEVLRAVGVMGIPAMIGYAGGREVVRRVGIQSPGQLRALFSGLARGEAAAGGPAPLDRALRLVAGLALGVIGWRTGGGGGGALLALGGLAAFSGVYDRCPVWRAISGAVRRRPADYCV